MVTSFEVCCLPSQQLPAGRILFARVTALSPILGIPKAVVPRTRDPRSHCPVPHDDCFKDFREAQ